MGLFVGLLVLWLVLAVIGSVVHAVIWLAWIAVLLFAVTAVAGWLRRRAAR